MNGTFIMNYPYLKFYKDKRLIGSFLFIIIFLAVIFFGLNPQETERKVHEVILTAEGFSPREITVQKGETIRFITSAGKYFWPASHSHPVHDLYPEFDSKKPVSPEDSWSFSFEKIGIWKYHDHLLPQHTGSITVIDTKKGIAGWRVFNNTHKTCDTYLNEEETVDCLMANLIVVAQEQGLKESFDLLTSTLETSPELKDTCHGLTHLLGEVAYDIFASTKDATIEPDLRFNYCGSGFYHGFIESLWYEQGDIYLARDFCERFFRQSQKHLGAFYSCIHGIGHGVTNTISSEMWGDADAIVDRNVSLCKQIGDDRREFLQCVGGVFNALENMYRIPEFKLTENEIERLNICKRQEDAELQVECYVYLGAPFKYISQNGFLGAVTRVVTQISNDIVAQRVTEQIAANAGLTGAYIKNPQKIIAECRLFNKFKTSCIAEFASALGFAPTTKGQSLQLQFCANEILTDEERTSCFARITWDASQMYETVEHEIWCARVPVQYRFYCPEGLNISYVK